MELPIGERLNETTALQLAADLSLADTTEAITVDFSHTKHFEPFAMLLASSAVNRLRKRFGQCGQQVDVRVGLGAAEGSAGHMGLWQSIGLPIGRPVNALRTQESHLPITVLDVADLYRQADRQDPIKSGLVESESMRLATVLNRTGSTALGEALAYAFRELIRNVIEHARTPKIWLAGMSWPKRDLVQVAVLDEGIGIRASLARHASFRHPTDAEAIRASLLPGVTRNLHREPTLEQLERHAEERHDRPLSFFQNSGYGLYAISTLCREAGQFLLASGNAAIGYVGSGEIQTATGHHGTAVRLVLRPSEVGDAMDRLFDGNHLRGPASRKPLLTASTLRRLGLDSLVSDAADSVRQD